MKNPNPVSMPRSPHASTLTRTVATLLALSAATGFVRAQAVSTPTLSATILAKYDTNKDGRLDSAETAAMQADEAKAAAAVTTTAGAAAVAMGDVVKLSPFEVTEANNGYYASNTMSGTRLNAKIENLGSAISVVTKQQMNDFGMIDIGDIFSHEASTEGPANFTDFTIDRNGMVIDNVQNNPQGANRIRGVGAANMAMNNFATSGRVPVDPISIDSVEISRGPNSNIFGLGQGSGTVNLNAATAKFGRETSTLEARMDSVGGYRTSIDLNRPLIDGKLAIRGSWVYQHDAYNEKPSGASSRRYNFMLRAQPFKNTSLRASFQMYDLAATRANTITPRDAVSYWKNLGSPTWDPVASAMTVNGVTTVLGATNPTTLGVQNFVDPVLFVDNGGIQLWMIGRMPAAGATNGPQNVAGIPRLMESIADPVRTGRPLYSTVRGISSKALYDYSSINLAGINSIKDHNETSTVELEHFAFQTDQQTLAFQLGWNREYANRLNRNIVGQASATGNSGYLYVDVNEKLLDGRPNPYFKRPYLGAGEPVHNMTPYFRDTYRGQLAYLLDATKSDKWTKWLGRHQIVGYTEQKLTKSHVYRFREANLNDNPVYIAPGQPKANQSGVLSPTATRGYYHFYVGDANGQNIDYAPSPIKYGNYNFNWYNAVSNAWVNEPATLGESAIQEGSAGNFASRNLLKTRGAMIQSTFLQDRLFVTLGKRHDENYNKFQRPSVLKANGYEFDYAAMQGWAGDWAVRSGDTNTKGLVVKPFRGWESIESSARGGGSGGFFAGLLRGMNLHYNESDSFQPEVPAINVLTQSLPNPSSNGKDYGFSLNLWSDKLVLRANRYETNQINTQNSQFGTFGQRVLRIDIQGYAGNNDAISLQRQARNWIREGNPALTTAQVDTQTLQLMGLTADQINVFNTNTIRDTQDVTAKGDEIELNYNPDRFWTLKGNITRTESLDANIAPSIFQWRDQRLPIWEKIIDPRYGTKWLDTPYLNDAIQVDGTGTPRAFLTGNVVTPIALAQATQGKSRPEIREWRYNLSASVRLAKYSENKFLKNMSVGGSYRWESRGAIGYWGIPIKGDYSIATQFDANRPIYAKANSYIDAFVTYNTRLFHDKVKARFQLNARNLQEWKARLEPIGAYPDGSPHTFRIIEPGTFIFTTTFEL